MSRFLNGTFETTIPWAVYKLYFQSVFPTIYYFTPFTHIHTVPKSQWVTHFHSPLCLPTHTLSIPLHFSLLLLLSVLEYPPPYHSLLLELVCYIGKSLLLARSGSETYLLAVWPSISYLTSLSFCFLTGSRIKLKNA